MAILATLFDAVVGVQTEILIFLVALCVHTVLFGSYRFRRVENGKQACSASKEILRSSPLNTKAGVALARVVKQLLRQGASRDAMREELQEQLRYQSPRDIPSLLASMLEIVGKNASSELLGSVRDVASELALSLSGPLADNLLRALLHLRMFNEFRDVLAEVEAAGATTPSVAVLALRSCLATSDFNLALEYVRRFGGPLKAGIGNTASSAPQQLVQQLLQLGIQQSSVVDLLNKFADSGFLTPWIFEAAVKECASKGLTGTVQLEELARKYGIQMTDVASGTLVRRAESAEDAMRIFVDAARRGMVGKDLMLAALEAGNAHRSAALTAEVVKCLPDSPAPEVAVAALRSIADGPLRGEDSDTTLLNSYERHMSRVDVLADARAGRLVAEAALRRGRPQALEQLVRCTTESSRLVGLVKTFAVEQRLADATAVFKACPEKTTCLYNALLDACIDCQDLDAAEKLMAEAVAADVADVVTYNTIIKKHLQHGHFQRARAVIEKMRSAGGSFAPNTVTFNELIDATLKNNSAGAWVLIEEMKASGLQPTSVTCSILLKSIQRSSRHEEIERTMAFVTELEDAMDEVLLSSVCEACIRAGRADHLAAQLKKQRSSRGIQINGAHAFGSVIRAYGYLKDLEGAWEAWTDMRARKVLPTSITIGCMVEALVSNGDPDAGFKLIHELSCDEKVRPLLNAIVYCSVLKGFTHQKSFDRVWVVYEEMIEAKLQFSIVTYNALIDACARAGEMVRVQQFLQDMARDKIEPNIVTYSTIVKGYCQEGRLDKAFELLEAMKKSHNFRPDEITYNTLIDGCAQRGMYEQGMKLLGEMQESGVAPSNFTLSVLVKLANRAKRPDSAFELVEELSRKYHLQPNVHVYDNLVHACTAHGDVRRALQVLERMLRHRVRPDLRTYALLLRGCVEVSEFQEAAAIIRVACCVRGAQLSQRLSKLSSSPEGHLLHLRGGLPTELLSEVLEAMAARRGEELLSIQLCKELRSVPGVRLDAKLSMNLTSRALRC